MIIESHARTVLKTFSWRLFSVIITILFTFFVTKEWEFAFALGGFDIIFKSGLYFFHEKIWLKIKYGKKSYRPIVVWLTGLSGAGKTTIAIELAKSLKEMGLKVHSLDGDEIRKVFTHTGFTREERENHIERVAHLASQLEMNGIVVIVALVSPFEKSRQFARSICKNFVEVHVDTPLEVCMQRDVKGLYKKAMEGNIKNFTGIGQDYEIPLNPEVRVNTVDMTVEDCKNKIIKNLNFY